MFNQIIFAKRLMQCRNAEKKTKEQVANALGIKHSSYQNLESATTVPSRELLIAIANFYNVSLDYLCDRTNNPHYFIFRDRAIQRYLEHLPKTMARAFSYIINTMDLPTRMALSEFALIK